MYLGWLFSSISIFNRKEKTNVGITMYAEGLVLEGDLPPMGRCLYYRLVKRVFTGAFFIVTMAIKMNIEQWTEGLRH